MSCVNILDNDDTITLPPVGPTGQCAYALSCGQWNQNLNATALETLAFYPDGLWQLINNNVNPTSVDVIASGAWISNAFLPYDYQIRVTGTKRTETHWWSSGDWASMGGTGAQCGGFIGQPPTVSASTPFDTGWMPMNVINTVKATVTVTNQAPCVQFIDAFTDYTIEIKQVSNPANVKTFSGTLCARAENCNTSVLPP